MPRLIKIEPGQIHYLNGYGKFNVIHGSISIHGAIVTSESKELLPYKTSFGYEIFAASTPLEKSIKKALENERPYLQDMDLSSINFTKHAAVIYVDDEYNPPKDAQNYSLQLKNIESLSTKLDGYLISSLNSRAYANAQFVANFLKNTKFNVTLVNLDPLLNGSIWSKSLSKPIFTPLTEIVNFEQCYFLGSVDYGLDADYYNELVEILLSKLGNSKNKLVVITPEPKRKSFGSLKNLSFLDHSLIQNTMIKVPQSEYFENYFSTGKVFECAFSNFAIALGNDVNPSTLSESLYLLYGATVGLGNVPEFESKNDHPKFYLNFPRSKMFGWGIINYIDRVNMKFTILTPIDLKNVNLILFGQINKLNMSIASPNVEIQVPGYFGVVKKKSGILRESQKKQKGQKDFEEF